MLKKLFTFLAIISLTLAPISPVNAVVKAGAACPKAGNTAIASGKTFTCIKSGKKLVWDKGKLIENLSRTEKPNSNSSSQSQNKNYEISPSIASAEECKIKDAYLSSNNGYEYNNVGFPIKNHELPIKGELKTLFLPVAFKDLPGNTDVTSLLNNYGKNLRIWAEHFTNKQLNFEVTVHQKWVTLPEASSDFQIETPGTPNFLSNQTKLAEKIIQAAANSIDFTTFNAVLIYWSNIPNSFHYDLALRDFEVKGSTDAKRIFMWSPGPFMYTNYGTDSATKKLRMWQFYLHEMLHSQGIIGHAPAGFDTGLGNSIHGASSSLDSWSLFLAGWTLDSQIYCAPKTRLSKATIRISILDQNISSGIRSIIIPISDKEAIVIEARKAIDFSSDWPKGTEGILAFTVDTSKRNDPRNPLPSNSRKFDSWSYYLPPNNLISSGIDYDGIKCQDEVSKVGCSGIIDDFRKFLLGFGDFIEYAGVKITLESFAETAIVTIEKLQ